MRSISPDKMSEHRYSFKARKIRSGVVTGPIFILSTAINNILTIRIQRQFLLSFDDVAPELDSRKSASIRYVTLPVKVPSRVRREARYTGLTNNLLVPSKVLVVRED